MEKETVSIRQSRAIEKIKRDLGDDFLTKFRNKSLVEVMVNPDGGNVFWEKQGESMLYDCELSAFLNDNRIESVIRTVAGFHGKVITEETPILECTFPLDGSRFTGLIPPIVNSPSFTIRKKPNRVFTLDEYVSNNIMTLQQKTIIQRAVIEKKNILVIGSTGSGKTTLVNAVIREMTDQFPADRLYISEDTGEIQCEAKNRVQTFTTINVDLTKIIKTALRYRPDRIIVGEVRGAESLDLLDAWNTGHPGGIATLHANSAADGLLRLEQLITRNPAHPKEIRPLLAAVVDYIIFIGKHKKTGRKIEEILQLSNQLNTDNSYSFTNLCSTKI